MSIVLTDIKNNKKERKILLELCKLSLLTANSPYPIYEDKPKNRKGKKNG